ncbi:ATP synthase F0F1 subunit delta [Robbsia andropogonis]|uniref:ATP synthase subunit delta n=1 Tax=Robbsia andropogonis TaxID=28092 RepID=A0A0F5K2X6_9BURK|nr:F0F1 ATP synthase subunit delta [Robbsia andropogonis]KKB64476.1 ATP synthase F0F1 subunit delta [Robbsia andropogonis]MCP1119039.1 F0F1 ATP synthase subunit delta [Robbsia andropogonis]MCP1128609.1 F0F1 ATP synthase subunit delta [Robbsia andropogonis]
MAELATIARPYAEAAFDVARAPVNGQAAVSTDAWLTQLQALAQVASHPDVRTLANDPKISRAQIFELITGASGVTLAAPVKNFVQMLVDNRRIALLSEIAAQFEALKHASEGISDAVITSAYPLEGKALTELVAALEKKFGRKLQAQVVVDPALIGGVSVAVGDEVLDTSVRARLTRMQASLAA